MSLQLKPHQIANGKAIFESLKKYGAGIDMSDTGTGKTYTILGLCKAIGASPGIITRKSVMSGWADACKALEIQPTFLLNYEKAKSDKSTLGRWVETVKRRKADGTVKQHYKFEWSRDFKRTLLIFDESQNCSLLKTDNGKLLTSAAGQYKTVLLSATPFATPLQSGPQAVALGLTTPGKWREWILHHGCYRGPFDAMCFIGDKADGIRDPVGTNAAKGAQIMADLRHLLIPERGCLTKRSEIPDFPETQYGVVTIDPAEDSELLKPYLAAIEEARAMDVERLREGMPEELWDILAPLAIVDDLRDRQEAELRKLPIFEELAEDALSHGESVAIFLNFRLSIQALAKRLGTKCIIQGDTKGTENLLRANAIRGFQSNSERVVIVNSAAGGAGLSLHDPITQVPRTSLISPPWSSVVLKQVLGRTHRLGGGFSTQKLVFSSAHVEQRVALRVKNRLQSIDSLTDADLSFY